MCVKNIIMAPQFSGVIVTWVVEHVESLLCKTNTPPRKEFSLVPIKKIATLVLPSTFVDML